MSSAVHPLLGSAVSVANTPYHIPVWLGVGGSDEPPPVQSAIAKLELSVRLVRGSGSASQNGTIEMSRCEFLVVPVSMATIG